MRCVSGEACDRRANECHYYRRNTWRIFHPNGSDKPIYFFLEYSLNGRVILHRENLNHQVI